MRLLAVWENKKDGIPSKIEVLQKEFERAVEEYNFALQNFENAEGDFITVAVFELEGKRKKIDAIKKLILKEMSKTAGF